MKLGFFFNLSLKDLLWLGKSSGGEWHVLVSVTAQRISVSVTLDSVNEDDGFSLGLCVIYLLSTYLTLPLRVFSFTLFLSIAFYYIFWRCFYCTKKMRVYVRRHQVFVFRCTSALKAFGTLNNNFFIFIFLWQIDYYKRRLM